MAEEESEVDKKKEEEEGSGEKSLGSQIGGFIGSMIGITIIMLIILFSGSLMMFGCKVSQTNILPTAGDCFPYTTNDPVITPISVNANLTTVEDDVLSQKVQFNFEENRTNRILDYLRKISEHPTQSSFMMYITSILKDIILLNFQIVNYTFNFMNSSISESLIVYLMPIIALVTSPLWLFGIFVVNFLYFYYYLFSRLSWFFKKNENEDKTLKQKWSEINMSKSPFGYITSLFIVSIFVVILIVSLIFQFPIITILISGILIYVYATLVSVMGKREDGKDYSATNVFLDNAKYKRSTMMYIMSIMLIMTSFTKMGPLAGIFSVVAFILLYFQIVPIPVFVDAVPEGLSAVTSYDLAEKICEPILKEQPSEIEEPKRRSLLNRLTFGLLKGGEQQTGGNAVDMIDKNVKKLNKLLNKLEQ